MRRGRGIRSRSQCCHRHETLISQSVITSLVLFQSLIIILGNDHKQNEGKRVTSKNVNDMENNFTEIGSHDFSYGQIIFVVLMFESRPQFTQSLVSV